MAEAIPKIKTAIKTSNENLGNVIKRVFSRKDGLVDLELADANGGSLGRFQFAEQSLLDDADLISQQRWKNHCEASWAGSAESGVIDAEEVLTGGQQFTKSGRIKVLKTNTSYTSSGYSYSTDGLGRIKSAEGELRLSSVPREQIEKPYAQSQAGRIDRVKGNSDWTLNDDGGHLIGSQFEGSGDLDNLVPMNAQINRSGGKWYQMEQEWKAALETGEKVNVKIEPVYPSTGVSQRPVSFEVRYKIGDGDWVEQTILNQIGG